MADTCNRIKIESSLDNTGTTVKQALNYFGFHHQFSSNFLCFDCLGPLKKLQKCHNEISVLKKQLNERCSSTLKRKSQTALTPPQQKSAKISKVIQVPMH